MTFNAAPITALFLAAALAGALLAILPFWRRLQRTADLPLWKFLRRDGVVRHFLVEDLGERAVREAELRCGVCAAQKECTHRLAREQTQPLAHCPNSALFPNLPNK